MTGEINPRLKKADCVIGIDVHRKVAQSIGPAWKWLGRAMDLEDVQLESIKSEFGSEGLGEMAYQMLNMWKGSKSKTATVNELARHLEGIGRTDLATEILQMVEEAPATEKPKVCEAPTRSPSESSEKSGSVAITHNTITKATIGPIVGRNYNTSSK